MNVEFDKKIMLENISLLLEKSGKKVGELESEVGVSIGYISRLSKDDKSKPGIEFVVGAAASLGVSIDMLVNVNLSKLTPTEKYLFNFIDKLISDTKADKLDWNKEAGYSLVPRDGDYLSHPLFSWEICYDDVGGSTPTEVERCIFCSESFDKKTQVHGDCFNLKIKNGYRVYLMNIARRCDFRGNVDAVAKEICIVGPDNEKNSICSNRDKPLLAIMAEKLYLVVTEFARHPKIKKDLKVAMDGFMNDDFSDDLIPF